MQKRKLVPHGPSRAPATTNSNAVCPIYVGEGLDPPAQNAPPHSLKPHVETQNVPFLVILSERSESKDLRIIDTAKILRFAALTQDDNERNILRFHIGFGRKRSCILCGRVKTLPYSSDALHWKT